MIQVRRDDLAEPNGAVRSHPLKYAAALRLIEAACRGDVEAFWAESRRVGDKYNVCGFSALACLLEALPEVQGRLLGYEFSQEEPTQSAVSYAAIAFTHSQAPAG